ncbi:IS200/IS605 family transposase [Aerosakkonema funiforme]|uniref:IS200/IS605 family transposase n=1 Tax=Aerosakkonema funiforme TaxID=1246630 RepID=UPI0035BA7631
MYNHGFRSVYKLNAHIVLVVKYRRKGINVEILNRLKEIITAPLKKWDCELLEFNGEPDRVHILIDYKPDKPLSTLIENIKVCTDDRDRNRLSARINEAISAEESLPGKLIRVIRLSR